MSVRRFLTSSAERGASLWTRALASLLSLSLATACGTLTVQEEKKLGHEAQRQIQSQVQLMREPVVVNYIRDIGAEVARSAASSVFDFRFYVVEDESINAFAIPGGAIYIHTGLIQKAANKAERTLRQMSIICDADIAREFPE